VGEKISKGSNHHHGKRLRETGQRGWEPSERGTSLEGRGLKEEEPRNTGFSDSVEALTVTGEHREAKGGRLLKRLPKKKDLKPNQENKDS